MKYRIKETIYSNDASTFRVQEKILWWWVDNMQWRSKDEAENYIRSLQTKEVKYHTVERQKAHTPISGGDRGNGVKVKTTGEHENRAADRGCCVSPCSISSFLLEGLRHKDPAVRVMKYLAVTTLIGHIVLIGGSLIYYLLTKP